MIRLSQKMGVSPEEIRSGSVLLRAEEVMDRPRRRLHKRIYRIDGGRRDLIAEFTYDD